MPGMDKTMHEWKQGTLHSGSKSGPMVKSRKQAIAIGLNQERRNDVDSVKAVNKVARMEGR